MGSRQSPLRTSLDASVAEGAAAEVFGACAGGAVLTGWAVFLGASPLVIGVLGALPFAAQILQMPAAWLTERLGAKPLAIVSIAASRLVWLPLVAVPFLHLATPTALALFLSIVAVAALLGVVGNNAWTAWMGDLVPGAIRGRFLARRMMYLNLAGTVSSLAAAVALDAMSPRGFEGETLGALAAVACVAGLAGIRLLLVQQTGARREDNGAPDWHDLTRPAHDPRARPLLDYLLAWNAAVGLSAGFFSFHMLTHLKMGFMLVAAYAIVVAALRITSAPVWGRLVDRCGARPVLILCSVGVATGPLIWLFVTPERLWPVLLEAALAGTLWGGHGIALFDLSIGVAPRRGRAFYLAAFAAAGGVGFAVSSIVAGLLATALATPLDASGSTWREMHVLFLCSAVGRGGTAMLALRIEEPAARSVRQLARALMSGLARRSTRLLRLGAAEV